MSFYKSLLFPIFKKFDPEKIHYFVMGLLQFAHRLPFVPTLLRKLFCVAAPGLERSVFGLHFKNPVGLAAGFDKNARWVDGLADLGFGFVEIGTVTPKAQAGNEKPRLFRLVKDAAIVNRMGFNNDGAIRAAELLRLRKSKVIVGGNIGKNKTTANEDAFSDYLSAFNTLFDYVDYFVVNVSSPNTPGLRALQEIKPLSEILHKLKAANAEKEKPKPILLKIAPDLTNGQLDDIVDIVHETGIDGLIATNTTTGRGQLNSPGKEIETIGAGGLSGKPLAKRSTEVISYIHRKSGGRFPIIGVGGIHTAGDAIEKLKAGASLVQVYSGFIYEGPSIVKKICKGICNDGSSLQRRFGQ